MCYVVNFWIQTFIVSGLGSPLRSVEAPSLAMNALPMGLHRRPAEQFPANHKQVHQSAGGKQSVGILLQSSVAHLHEPELQLHYSKHMLDLTAHSRFVPVPGPLDFIHPVFIATAPLGAVAGAWLTLMDDFALALIRPVAPH